jgi:hypothetical protein
MVVLQYLALTVPILVLAIGYGAGYMRMLIPMSPGWHFTSSMMLQLTWTT